ncbi:MAG: hypothetical protein DLM70_18300 [Chloroflexi bacterium]|nr:MAG: hypothetical protein DLM70_18300 [Chloroflexota bacterium]
MDGVPKDNVGGKGVRNSSLTGGRRYYSSESTCKGYKRVDDSDFELVASSLRADVGDLKVFMEALAAKLEGALPSQAIVERKSTGLLSKHKRVAHIAVDVASMRYEIRYDGTRVDPSRSTKVRGIVLKTEPMPLDRWIDELSQSLADEAQQSEQARLALQRLLGA